MVVEIGGEYMTIFMYTPEIEVVKEYVWLMRGDNVSQRRYLHSQSGHVSKEVHHAVSGRDCKFRSRWLREALWGYKSRRFPEDAEFWQLQAGSYIYEEEALDEHVSEVGGC